MTARSGKRPTAEVLAVLIDRFEQSETLDIGGEY